MRGFGDAVNKSTNKKLKQVSTTKSTNNELAQSLTDKAIVFYQKNELTSARVLLEKANKIKPENAFIIGFLATIEKAEGNIKDAERLFEISIRLDPNDPNILHNYSQLLLNSNITKALSLSERSVLLSPSNPNFLERLGFIKFEINDLSGSLEANKKAIKLDPHRSNAYLNIGTIR